MILIGQFDSPFVRRVGIALHLYETRFEHRPWSAFTDAALLTAINPLGRVPVLVEDDGTAILDSGSIIDRLDELAEQRATGSALMPRGGIPRRTALRRCALAMGVCDRAVALVYERIFHAQPDMTLVARLTGQIEHGLRALEADIAPGAEGFLHGGAPGHADIAVACATGFLRDAHPALQAGVATRRLAALCEALPAFVAVRQAFIPPR